MKLKNKIYTFISILIFLILNSHFLGIRYKGDLLPDKSSWNEIFNNLISYIFTSIIFTLIISVLIQKANKIDKKDMDAARKRIEERERKEKEESQEKDNKESNESEDEKR